MGGSGAIGDFFNLIKNQHSCDSLPCIFGAAWL